VLVIRPGPGTPAYPPGFIGCADEKRGRAGNARRQGRKGLVQGDKGPSPLVLRRPPRRYPRLGNLDRREEVAGIRWSELTTDLSHPARLIVSDSMMAVLGAAAGAARPLGKVAVKGYTEPVPIWGLD